MAAGELFLHSQGDFDCQRCHRFDGDVTDRRVERAAVHGLAKTALPSLQRAAAAPIGRYVLIPMRVIANRHAFAAGSTDHEPLQQCHAFASWPTAPFGAPRRRITLYALEIRLVIFPGNKARVHITQQYPLLAGHQTRAYFAIGQFALLGAAENEGTCIARIVDDLPRATV